MVSPYSECVYWFHHWPLFLGYLWSNPVCSSATFELCFVDICGLTRRLHIWALFHRYLWPHLILDVFVGSAFEQISVENAAVVQRSRVVQWGAALLHCRNLVLLQLRIFWGVSDPLCLFSSSALHLGWPASQSHGSVSQREQLVFCYRSNSTPLSD
jgi:hypothetical protein